MNLSTKVMASVALLLLALLTSLSHAENSKSDIKRPQKWYKVEVIIFTQRDVFGDELSSRNIVMSYPDKLINLNNNYAGFTALPNNEQELAPDAYSLNRTGVYKVLFHKAWRQPGLAPKNAPWVNIDIAKANTTLKGSLRIYLSSYLHMESNIWRVIYTKNLASMNPLTLSETEFEAPLSTPWPKPPSPPLRLSDTFFSDREIDEILLFKQESRLKLNKLHYFDHPKMGLLVKVSRDKVAVIDSFEKIGASKKTADKESIIKDKHISQVL